MVAFPRDAIALEVGATTLELLVLISTLGLVVVLKIGIQFKRNH